MCVLIAAYVGNDARKILSQGSADELEKLINAKAAGSHSSRWKFNIEPLLRKIVQLVRAYDTVIVRTMKLNLHPEWEAAIATFVHEYAEFSERFTNLFPRYRSDELMTPKIAYIQYEMVRWIKKFNRSLLYISEQAFEGVHYLFLAKEKHYKIPRTGEELFAGERRFTSDAAFGKKKKGNALLRATKKRSNKSSIASSSSTRSSSARTKRDVAKKSNEHCEFATSEKKTNINTARKLLVQAVAAFNAENILTCGDGCYDRMQEVLKYIESGKDRKNAPWKFKPNKSKPKKKNTDELWQM